MFITLKSTIRSILLGLNVLLVLAIATTVYNSQFLLNNNSIMVYAQQMMGMPPSGMGMEQQQPAQVNMLEEQLPVFKMMKMVHLLGYYPAYGKVL